MSKGKESRKENGDSRSTGSALGDFIKQRRRQLKLTQRRLGDQVEIDQSIISTIETGRRRYLNSQQLEVMAEALKCQVNELLRLIPERRRSSDTRPKTELGHYIRDQRQKLGLSLCDLAKLLGISLQRARGLENRRSPTMRYDLLVPLSRALKLHPSNLAKYTGAGQSETKSDFGRLIRARRQERGMSMAKLAEQLSVSRQYVSLIENGNRSLCHNKTIIARLVTELELDPKQLNAYRAALPNQSKARSARVERLTQAGKMITEKRRERKLRQVDLANQAGTSLTVISGLERGNYPLSLALAKRINRVLKIKFPPEMISSPKKRGRPKTRGTEI